MTKAVLSDLCTLVTQQVDPQRSPSDLYVGLEHVASGRMTRESAGSAGEVQSSKYRFQTNDVLYGKLRPYLDKAVLADTDGVCTTELLVLRPKPDVDPRFLAALVHSPQFIEHAVAGTTGSQHPRTSWHHMAEFSFEGLGRTEQGGFAELVWSIHRALRASESALTCAHELKRAAMRELFTRGLRGEAQKDSEIGPVPERWTVRRLGTLGRIGGGTTPNRTRAEYWHGGTVPWITSGKMYEREVWASEFHVTAHGLKANNLPLLKPGALLIAIVGQGKTLGHCAILRVEATISRHVGYFQPDEAETMSGYIRGYLESRYDYLRQLASGNGSTRAALTAAILRDFPVPLPSTLEEQAEITSILDAIEAKIDLHKRKKVVLEELFRALLHKLMTGEIRVADLDLSALKPTPDMAA